MARTQFTFTFTNAQPGASVHFSVPVYADASTRTPDGPSLVLSASNAVSVWADAGFLIAVTVDGNGQELSATATADSPSVTTDAGTAGASPFGSGGSLPVPAPGNALQVLRVTAEGDGYELAAPSAGGLAVQPGDADFTTAIGDEGTVNIGDGGAPLLASKMTDDPHDRYQLWPDGNMFGGDGSADPSGLANIFPTNSGAGRYGWTVTGELHIQGASGTGDGNLYVEGVGNGIILKDPNGDPWLVTVGTDGTLGAVSA